MVFFVFQPESWHLISKTGISQSAEFLLRDETECEREREREVKHAVNHICLQEVNQVVFIYEMFFVQSDKTFRTSNALVKFF